MKDMLQRLTEKVERANALQHSGGKVSSEDWSELYALTNEARKVLGDAEPTTVTKIELGKDYVMPGGDHSVDFKCACGCTVLEEIMGGVIHVSNIRKIATEYAEPESSESTKRIAAMQGEFDAVYGESSQDGGEVESIQCRDCGKRYGSSLEEVVEHYQNALFPPVKRKHLKD